MEEVLKYIDALLTNPVGQAGAWLLGCSVIIKLITKIETLLPNSKDDLSAALDNNSVPNFFSNIADNLLKFIDEFFRFRGRSTDAIRLPSLLISMAMSSLFLIFVVIILQSSGTPIINSISELLLTRNEFREDGFAQYNQRFLGFSILIFVFLINYLSDYTSLVQTRLFIYLSRELSLIRKIFLVIFDFIASILIIVIFTSISVFIAYIFSAFLTITLYYQGPGLNYYDYIYFLNLAYYSAVLAALVVLDGACVIFGSSIPDMVFTEVHLYIPFLVEGLGYTSHIKSVPYLTFCLILTNLMTSIWIWFYCVSSIIQYVFRRFPNIYFYFLKWSDAGSNPYNALRFVSICVWTLTYPLLWVFGSQ